MNQTKALEKLKSAREAGYLVYARDEEVTMIRQQYETLITTIQFGPDHFCKTGSKKVGNDYEDVLYPLKHAQNQIAEACGISFTENHGTKERGKFSELKITKQGDDFIVEGDYSIIAWAQGTRLKPDGQLRTSGVCEHEYSVSDRCNLDFMSSKYPPKTIQEARKKLLEQKKFATRKADTGAKLAVIRELANIPTGFMSSDIKKPMLFTQIIESNDYKHNIIGALMSTPDGRATVAESMLGTKKKLYGEQGALPESDNATPPKSEFEPTTDDIPFDNPTEEQEESPEIQVLKNQLLDWDAEGEFKNNPENRKGVMALIADPNATLSQVQKVVDFVKGVRAKRGV